MRSRLGIGPGLVAGVMAVSGGLLPSASGATGSADAQGPPVDTSEVQLSAIELDHRAVELVDAFDAAKGASVASFGLSTPRVLRLLAKRLGPEGRLFTVHRSEAQYRWLSETLVPEFARSVQPILAADGDAHLDAGAAELVILIDMEGFFHREADLYRQAREILTPGGRLVILRRPRRTGRVVKGPPTTTPQSGGSPPSREPTYAERLRLESEGFRLVATPEVLAVRGVWILERTGG